MRITGFANSLELYKEESVAIKKSQIFGSFI